MTDKSAISRLPGLYLHIPFCLSKCIYCDFCSTPDFSSELVDRYINAIVIEAKYSKLNWNKFDSMYIGGGTPSLLKPEHLSSIFETITNTFDLSKTCEITLEANPGDITEEKTALWKNLGITRVSLGIQSLDDHVLAFLKRRHSSNEAIDAFHCLAEAEFKVAVDLIFGYPGHTIEAWKKTLFRILDLEPSHISCYQLTIENGTPISRLINKLKLFPISKDLEADLFKTSQTLLSNHGYDHYEISNYALNSNNYSQHNSKYWFRIPYLGLGVAAHSFDGAVRWSNCTGIEEYCDLAETNKSAISFSEEINKSTATIEQIFLGLRTKWGIKKHLIPESIRKSRQYENFIRSGWLIESSNQIQLTHCGFSVADFISEELIALII